MKKIISLLLTVIAVFALCSCKPAENALFTATHWLSSPSIKTVSPISEENQYSVTFTQAENAAVKISLTDASSYKTRLTSTKYNDKDCYLLETELKVVGSIANGEATTPIDDSIITKCYFLGLTDNFMPLYSERQVKSHSVIYNSGTYSVGLYDYVIKSTYADTSCVVNVTVTSKPDSDSSFVSSEKTYSGIKSGKYIDNEMLMLAPRGMTLSASTSCSFSTIDAAAKTNRKMVIRSVSAEPTKDIELANYFRNSGKVFNVHCDAITIAVDAKFPGSAITAYYAASNEKSEHASMIKANYEAPYGMGTYEFLIKSAVTNA